MGGECDGFFVLEEELKTDDAGHPRLIWTGALTGVPVLVGPLCGHVVAGGDEGCDEGCGVGRWKGHGRVMGMAVVSCLA